MKTELALWEERWGVKTKPFDFNLLTKNKNIQTIMNVPVKIDKVLYDLTGETAIGVSGTFIMKGVKVRGVWDSLGNILNFEKTGILFNWEKQFEKMFAGTKDSMFQLCVYKDIENE